RGPFERPLPPHGGGPLRAEGACPGRSNHGGPDVDSAIAAAGAPADRRLVENRTCPRGSGFTPGTASPMNPAAQSHEQVTDEVADLRARLAEASEALHAIRSGEVDAVLVQGPHGNQLFTLKGADEPYRVLIEEMNQGAVTLSADGSILYCNRRFADLLKTPLEEIVGLAFDAFVAPSERAGFAALLEAGRTGGSAGEITLRA